MIRKGDRVYVRPEFQDPGDSEITFLAVEDEDGGRVKIMAKLGMPIEPTQVVETRMLVT